MAWDRIAAAVTHRRSWAIALLIAGLVPAYSGAHRIEHRRRQTPLQLPPSGRISKGGSNY